MNNIVNSKNIQTTLDHETISKIIHRIGHDIGNPLTSIISLSSIIEKFSDPKLNMIEPAKLSNYAGTISSEAWKISRLSETMVHIFSTRQSSLSETSLEDVIDRALAKVEGQFTNSPEMEIKFEIFDNFKVLSDGDLLCFALAEVFRNAFQANIEYDLKAINISVQKTEQYCVLNIINELPAISELKIEDLFLPLVSHNKKISTPGLGLFATACILKRLQGYCEIEVSDKFRISIFLKWPS